MLDLKILISVGIIYPSPRYMTDEIIWFTTAAQIVKITYSASLKSHLPQNGCINDGTNV